MTATKQATDRLTHILQDEMAAVETYQKASHSLKNDATKASLLELSAVHETRVQTLQDTITKQGGELPKSSGLWGKFASLLEGGAAVLGDKSIVSTLEECEVKLLADYKSDLEVFDASEHKMIFTELLPSQQELYEKILALHKSLS
jgi:demethoxyubiquinone hydroxylase (CLK1/Coq7/Cat5 family)